MNSKASISLICSFLVTLLIANSSLAQESNPDPVLHLGFENSVIDSTGLNESIQVEGEEFVEDRNGKPNSTFYFDWMDDLKVFDDVIPENKIMEATDIKPIDDEIILDMSFSGALVDSSTYAHPIYEYDVIGKGNGKFIPDRFGNPENAYSFYETRHAVSILDESFYEAFDNREQFSISLWMNVKTYAPGNSASKIIEMPYRSSKNVGFAMQMDKYGKLKFYTGTNVLEKKNAFPQNHWVHVAITYNGEYIKLYLDGEEEQNITNFNNSRGIQIIGREKSLFIGSDSYHGDYKFSSFNNALDDIKIYNYVLTESDLNDLVDYKYTINVPEKSLLASLPFENSVEDESDIKNTIDVQGGHLASDRFGEENQAYSLSGENYIRYQDVDNKLDSLYKGLTFSAWIKADNLGADDAAVTRSILLSKTDQEPADKVKFWIYKDNNYSINNRIYFEINGQESFVPSTNLIEGHWIHVAGTYDGETLKTFLNGEIVKKVNHSTSLSLTESDLFIGGKADYLETERGFEGVIDEVNLYNYALPDSIILSLYDLNQEERKFDNEMIAYLPFDGTPNDSSKNSNPTVVVGTSLTKDRFDEDNKAYNFSDSTDAIVIKNETAELDSIYSGLTLQAWVKINEHPVKGASIISRKDDSEFGGFHLGIFDVANVNTFNFRINKAEVEGYSITKRGLWYLVTGTFDGSTMKLFVDGELVRQGEYSGRIEMDKSDIYIGNNNSMNGLFNGSIDDVRIYNYSLEEAEILDFYQNRFLGYNLPPQNLLQISFENSLQDSSEENHSLKSTGGGYVEDRFGEDASSYSFDGVDDVVYIENPESKIDSISYGLTVSTWVKIREESTEFPVSTLVSRSDGQFDNYYLKIIDGESDDWGYDYRIPEAEGVKFGIGDSFVRFRDTPIKAGEWFHVAGTYNGERLKLYVNGILVTSTIYKGIIKVSESNFYVGNNEDGSHPFYGDLDEVQIYNFALSDNAIAAMVDIETLPVSNEPEPELPSRIELAQNYPNPFNPTTQIEFSLPATGNVTLKVFNTIGHEVALLEEGRLSAGAHSATFDASRLSSGVYFYQLTFDGKVSTKKMLLIK